METLRIIILLSTASQEALVWTAAELGSDRRSLLSRPCCPGDSLRMQGTLILVPRCFLQKGACRELMKRAGMGK